MTVTVDLPCVEKREDVTLEATEDSLRIEAKMRKPVTLRLTGASQTHAEFGRFSKKVHLPKKVEPEKCTARFVSGFLIVRLPIRHEGKAVKID
jgi:HSP20 family protein